MSASRPCGGDLVVTRSAGSDLLYTIAQVPGAPQACWASRDAALDVARGFARRHRVDVWLSDGRYTVLLSRYRPVEGGSVRGNV